MTAELIKRHDLMDCAEFYSCVDEFDIDGARMLLMHVDVHRYVPSVLRRMRHAWTAFRNCTAAPLFAIEPSPDDAKWERFVTAFGFRFSSRVDYPDGSSRRVFISYKNGPEDHHTATDEPDGERELADVAVGHAEQLPQ